MKLKYNTSVYHIEGLKENYYQKRGRITIFMGINISNLISFMNDLLKCQAK